MTATHRPGSPRIRRMPRSNTTHPDESLAGYLLNLAHRLDMRPDDLLRRTGLKTTARIHLLDAQYAVVLPPDARDRFTTATGLTSAEAINLTIERYEGVTYTPGDHTRTARSLHGQQWVNLGRTRYCPECLADDQHANAAQIDEQAPDQQTPEHALWKVEWLTPWALACTRHQRLLLDACPRCQHPTGSSGARLMSAVPNPDAPVEHPAACRAALTSKADSLCNQRLDHTTAPTAPAQVLTLQETLEAILRGTTPHGLTSLGIPVAGPQYLRDLRLLAILLQLTNAKATLRVHDAGLAAASRAYLQQRASAVAAGEKENRTLTQPPDHTAAAAGLLVTAAELLADKTSTTDIAKLHNHVRHDQPLAWDKACRTVPPSQRLFALIADTKIGFADPRRLWPYTEPLNLTITADQVPAYLDADTYNRHFADLHPRYERPVRRCAPMMLIRLLADCDSTAAGRLLDYDEAPTLAAFARASDAFDHLGLDQFRTRLATIAAELNAAPRTNYAHRRAYFDQNWLLPDHIWGPLQQAMRARNLVRLTTDLEPRRAAFSAWIWQIVTHGDHAAAPMILTAGLTKRHTGGQANLVASLQRRSPAGVHDLIHQAAHRLAACIDGNDRPPHHASNPSAQTASPPQTETY